MVTPFRSRLGFSPCDRRYHLSGGFVKAQTLLAVILAGATGAFPQGGPRSGGPPMHPKPPQHSFPSAFPVFLGDYGYSYSGYAPAPNVVVVQQPPLYVLAPQAPSEPPKPEIHEYRQPAAAEPPVDEQTAFAIVLKDGSVHYAVAVTVQASALHYVEPDGGHRLVSLDVVDREATRRLNRERKLQLQLPPAT
jgi:hypothetical protein